MKPLTKEQKAASVVAVPQVLVAIHQVSAALSRDGIAKGRKNQQQNYNFRGIDEVMNALAPLLVEHELIIMPRILERAEMVRTTKSGSNMYSVTVAAEFVFLSVADGSSVTARTYGEAMDTADKATNKAMAVAYKYAAFQTFCIPTEGDGSMDADATTPETTVTKSAAKPEPKPRTTSQKAIAARDAAAAAEPPIDDEIPHMEPKGPVAPTPPTGPVVTAETLLEGDNDKHQGMRVVVNMLKHALQYARNGQDAPKGLLMRDIDDAVDRWTEWFRVANVSQNDRDFVGKWLDTHYTPAHKSLDAALLGEAA